MVVYDFIMMENWLLLFGDYYKFRSNICQIIVVCGLLGVGKGILILRFFDCYFNYFIIMVLYIICELWLGDIDVNVYYFVLWDEFNQFIE